MLNTILWLPLLAACLNGGLTESKLLRGLAEIPSDAVVCITEEQCRQKYGDMNMGGYFYVVNISTKGCFSKNNNGYFGTGGSIEEMSFTDIPSLQERIWCDPTGEPTPNPVTDSPTKQPTSKPITGSPSKQPSPKPVTDSPTAVSSSQSVIVSPSKQPTPKPVTDSPTTTKQPTSKPTLQPVFGLIFPPASTQAPPTTVDGNEAIAAGGAPSSLNDTPLSDPTKQPTEKLVTDSPTIESSADSLADSPTKQPTPSDEETSTDQPTAIASQDDLVSLLDDASSKDDGTWSMIVDDSMSMLFDETSLQSTVGPSFSPTFSPTKFSTTELTADALAGSPTKQPASADEEASSDQPTAIASQDDIVMLLVDSTRAPTSAGKDDDASSRDDGTWSMIVDDSMSMSFDETSLQSTVGPSFSPMFSPTEFTIALSLGPTGSSTLSTAVDSLSGAPTGSSTVDSLSTTMDSLSDAPTESSTKDPLSATGSSTTDSVSSTTGSSTTDSQSIMVMPPSPIAYSEPPSAAPIVVVSGTVTTDQGSDKTVSEKKKCNNKKSGDERKGEKKKSDQKKQQGADDDCEEDVKKDEVRKDEESMGTLVENHLEADSYRTADQEGSSSPGVGLWAGIGALFGVAAVLMAMYAIRRRRKAKRQQNGSFPFEEIDEIPPVSAIGIDANEWGEGEGQGQGVEVGWDREGGDEESDMNLPMVETFPTNNRSVGGRSMADSTRTGTSYTYTSDGASAVTPYGAPCGAFECA